MALVHQLFTPATVWPPLESVNWAINSQAGIQAQAEIQQDQLVITHPAGRNRTVATMRPFDPGSYELVKRSYQERMTARDRSTALPFERTVVVTTISPETSEMALCQVAVADGLWWLLGGFLADAKISTLWGWRSWRGESNLAQHAADLLGRSELPPLPQPAMPSQSTPRPTAAQSSTHEAVIVYTLPYCPDCRAIKQLLDSRGVRYQEINLAASPGAVDRMLRLSDGKRSAPTVQIGKQVLVDPVPDDLVALLHKSGLL